MNPTKYSGSGVSPDVKEQVTLFCVALQSRGVSVSTMVDSLKKTNYAPARRTLTLHMSKIKRGESIFPDNKASGRPPALSEEEWHIVCGWILLQNTKVDLEGVTDWIHENFEILLSKPSVSRNLKRLELTFQLVSTRPTKANSWEEYVSGYFDCLMELQELGFWDFDESRIICLDFVTNSYRLDREMTLNLKGENQKN